VLSSPALALLKAVAMVVTTTELAKNPGATGLIGRELQKAIVRATDTRAIAVVIAAGTSSATAGGTVANLATDIKTAFAAIEVGADSRLYWTLSPALAAALSARLAGSVGWGLTPTGGTLAGVPVVVSAGVSAGDLVLVDASRFSAFSDTITLAESRQGVVQMDSAPDSPPTASTAYQSLWQVDKVALRVEASSRSNFRLNRFSRRRVFDHDLLALLRRIMPNVMAFLDVLRGMRL
jgi:hypothetical protein